MVIPVGSLDDPRLDDYRNVPDPELMVRRGLFIAEGRHVVRRLLTSRFRIRTVLLTPAARHALADVVEASRDLPTYIVEQEVMNGVTGFNMHGGCLAVGERPSPARVEDVTHDAARIVVLERVSNADNVGAIFRNAAAFGAGAVLLGPSCADPLYRKAIRTSMGAALHVPFAMLNDWPTDLERLRAAGFTLLALTPDETAPPMQRVTLGSVERVALLVGHEGEGLSRQALAIADARVRIPMAAGVDSLNVATATAVALYALAERREQGSGSRDVSGTRS